MDALLQAEVAVNLFLQGLGSWLTTILSFFTFLGNEEFYLLVMPILYWCVDAQVGLRIGIMLLLSNGVNSIFKLTFHSPRPYWIDTRVKAIIAETSFGLPSGHAQNAASLWGLGAALAPWAWAKPVALAIIFLIGLSRLALGVHFTRDVLAGWLIGGLLLWAFLRLEKRVAGWVKRQKLSRLVLVALFSSIGLILAGWLVQILTSGLAVPAEWAANALLAAPEEPIDPTSITGFFTLGGTWFGLLAGAAVLYARFGPYNAGGDWGKRALRYLIGVVGVGIFYFGLGQIFPREANLVSYLLRYFRYMLVGLWIALGAPWLFVRMGLATFATGKHKGPKHAAAKAKKGATSRGK